MSDDKLDRKAIRRAQEVFFYKHKMHRPDWVHAFRMSVNGQELLWSYWWSIEHDWLDLIEYERKCASNDQSNQ